MGKKVIIVGGGLAGLSAGCYAAMNGFETRIFEHHVVPGGVAAAWKRGGYLIDGGIHFLVGCKPGEGLYGLLSELGAADRSLYTDVKGYGRFVHEPSGISLTIGDDPDGLAAQLKAMAPDEAAIINDIFKGVRAFRGRDMSSLGMSRPPELASFFSRAKEMTAMLSVMRYFGGRHKRNMREFAAGVRTPWLKDFLVNLFLPESPAWFVMMCLAVIADGQASYLAGGCLSFVLAIERRFTSLGGTVSCGSTVDRILVSGGKAVGVRLEDGREFLADHVIACGDGHGTIFKLLEGRYVNDKISERYRTRPLCRPFFMASFGVNREFKDEMPFNSIILDGPVVVGGGPVKGLFVRILNYSPQFAPAGKCVLQVEAETSFEYWNNLHEADPEKYEREKTRTTGDLLEIVGKYYPGIAGRVEVADAATPYTTWRYTLNHQGSWGGWLLDADHMMENVERRLPGLGNLYLAGHWVLQGVPGVLFSGRHAVQLMCADDGRKFVAGTD